MSRFDFALKYVAGKSMKQADWIEGVKRDTKNQVMLKKEWLKIRAMEKIQLLIERAKEEIIEKIKKLEIKDDEIVKVVEEMKKTKVKVLRNNEWQIEDKLVLKERKVYVSKDKSLRLEIIQLHYNMPIAGHGRQ